MEDILFFPLQRSAHHVVESSGSQVIPLQHRDKHFQLTDLLCAPHSLTANHSKKPQHGHWVCTFAAKIFSFSSLSLLSSSFFSSGVRYLSDLILKSGEKKITINRRELCLSIKTLAKAKAPWLLAECLQTVSVTSELSTVRRISGCSMHARLGSHSVSTMPSSDNICRISLFLSRTPFITCSFCLYKTSNSALKRFLMV